MPCPYFFVFVHDFLIFARAVESGPGVKSRGTTR
jgi:hypothetical protein